MAFYPNKCFICNARESLKRCSRCNMISYCGEPHQKRHWKYHKVICKLVSDLMKEKGISHIYENLHNVDQRKWKNERYKMYMQIESKMPRSFKREEIEMFLHPRACFVCHDTKQNRLRNCPGCPLATFCVEHPSSSLHDKDCSIIKQIYDLEVYDKLCSESISYTLHQMISHTSFANESSKLPTSMKEFFIEDIKNRTLPDYIKFLTSEYLSYPLSIYNALNKLNESNKTENSNSKMIIHILGRINTQFAFIISWEILLHLIPDLNYLEIIYGDMGSNKTLVSLCNKCSSKNKKLLIYSYEIRNLELLKQGNYKQPNLVAIFNINPPEEKNTVHEIAWKREMEDWNLLNCPLVLTVASEKNARFATESLYTTFGTSSICYVGSNDFAPLYFAREWEEPSVCKNNQFLFTKVPKAGVKEPAKGSFPFVKAMQDLHESNKKPSKIFFCANLCHVCRSTNASVACKHCKMIFYCGKKSHKDDLPRHKDLCKVILGMLVETGSIYIFDKLKSSDSESWLKAKLDLIKKVRSKIKRDLEDYEKQMFLFPKTCFVCHESDLSILRSCECGITICKNHKDDPKHKKLCRDYFLFTMLKTTEKTPKITAIVKPEFFNRTDDTLPPSMKSFTCSYITLSSECLKFDGSVSPAILLHDALSMPLTLLYALQKLNLFSKKELKIHILGTIYRGIAEEKFWMMLNYPQNVKKLKLIFFNSDVSKLSFNYTTDVVFSDFSFLEQRNLEGGVYRMKYEDYFRMNSFEKPDIVVGYNLNIHEVDYGIFENNWRNTISTLERINVPFVMTSGSEERARKDHNKLCSFLGKTVDYIFCEENPYSSVIPERDFETEGLHYPNKYIIIYNDFNKTVVNKSPGLTFGQLKKEVADFEITGNEAKPNAKCETDRAENKKELKTVEVKSSNFEIELRAENKEVGTKSVGIENSNFGIELETKNNEVKTKCVKIESPKCETKSGIEHKEFKGESCPDNDTLIRENLLLTNINKLMKENIHIIEENEQIRIENMKLKEDYEKLISENQLIKNIHQEVHEIIHSAMKKKK